MYSAVVYDIGRVKIRLIILLYCRRVVFPLYCTGFRTPVGFLVIAGLHVFPIVHYGMERGMLAWLNPVLQPARVLLAIGRIVCAATEVSTSLQCACRSAN